MYLMRYDPRFTLKELGYSANSICLEWTVHSGVHTLAYQVLVHDTEVHTKTIVHLK